MQIEELWEFQVSVCLQEPHRLEGDIPEPHGVSSASLHLCKLVTKPASTTSSAHNKKNQHLLLTIKKTNTELLMPLKKTPNYYYFCLSFRWCFQVSEEKKIEGPCNGASPEAGTLNKIPRTGRCSRQWQAQLLLCLCSTLQKTERALSAQQSKKIFIVT